MRRVEQDETECKGGAAPEGADPIPVYLGLSGNNPAGPWCVCSLGVMDGKAYPRTRFLPGGPRTIKEAAWAAVDLALERLRGRPALIWTTLKALEDQADRMAYTWDAQQGIKNITGPSFDDPVFGEIKRRMLDADTYVCWVRAADAPPWMAQAKEAAQHGFLEGQRSAVTVTEKESP